jgi:hypothetical protein
MIRSWNRDRTGMRLRSSSATVAWLTGTDWMTRLARLNDRTVTTTPCEHVLHFSLCCCVCGVESRHRKFALSVGADAERGVESKFDLAVTFGPALAFSGMADQEVAIHRTLKSFIHVAAWAFGSAIAKAIARLE